MAMSDVLVIGAGPFGLSISAHLRHRGVEHTIVGRPMNTWREHMPLGLFLKSEPYGSAISAPTPGYEIATYARLHGFDDYVDRVGPLSLDRFLGYADWFTEQLVPDIRDLTVTNVVPTGDGFKVEFADEAPVLARSVIVATGILPYAYLPAELSGLPDLITHSVVHDRLDKFSGRRVAVIGGGQSSLQTAALLHEAGADVQVVMRGQAHRLGRQAGAGPQPDRPHPAAAGAAVRGVLMRRLQLPGHIPADARVHSRAEGAVHFPAVGRLVASRSR